MFPHCNALINSFPVLCHRSRLTVKHDRPFIISAPMNSTVHQYTVDKYKLKVDNQNHKRKVDSQA